MNKCVECALIIACIFMLMFYLYFHRRPAGINKGWRVDDIVCPSYGVVRDVIENEDGSIHIIIILDICDIHAQYVPVRGRIKSITHDRSGIFNIVLSKDSPQKTRQNEKIITEIETETNIVKVIQIAGFLTRRILSNLKEGDIVSQGEHLGMICLGSRVDIVLPSSAHIYVRNGQRVRGGIDLIGRMNK